MLYHRFVLISVNSGAFFCGPFPTLARAQAVKNRMDNPDRYVVVCRSIPAQKTVWEEAVK